MLFIIMNSFRQLAGAFDGAGPVVKPETKRTDQRREMPSDIYALVDFEPAIPQLKGTSPHTFDRRL
jgi:hypothetical protein